MSLQNSYMQQNNTSEQLKVFLVDIVPPTFPADLIEHRMNELESLVTTYQ